MLFNVTSKELQDPTIAIRRVLSDLPTPKYSNAYMQVAFGESIMAIWDEDVPELSPEKRRFALEWSGGKWQIMSKADYDYFFG